MEQTRLASALKSDPTLDDRQLVELEGFLGDALACQDGCIFYVSSIILEEVRRALQRPKLMALYRYTPEQAEAYVKLLAGAAEVVTRLPEIEPVCRDPNDDHVLAAALAKTALIVTGDADLLALGIHNRIEILNPRAFLELVGT